MPELKKPIEKIAEALIKEAMRAAVYSGVPIPQFTKILTASLKSGDSPEMIDKRYGSTVENAFDKAVMNYHLSDPLAMVQLISYNTQLKQALIQSLQNQ